MMVPTLDEGKHQSWGPFSARVKHGTQEETKHLFWNKVGTTVLKNKNVTVSACSGAKFGVLGANNLKGPCMHKRQRKERVNRHSVVSETEKIPQNTRYQMLSTPLPGNDTGLRAQLLPVQRPKSPSTTTPGSLFWLWLSKNTAKLPLAFGTATLPQEADSTNCHFQGNAISTLTGKSTLQRSIENWHFHPFQTYPSVYLGLCS